jgi:4-amino-4-deoxy-L-arabinose transferase-like glycosyltransferase
MRRSSAPASGAERRPAATAPPGAGVRLRDLDALVGRVLARVDVRALDLALAVSLTALAAVIRIWHLGTVPLGLHGDEALTGIDARRVLHEGWIGPYVISALGQPTGPLYFTALLFKFLPQDTFTIRLSMALFGVATIPLAYAAFALMFNRTVGAFAALFLAVMTWHLHLSRTGFMVTAWPFVEMLVLVALFAALRARSVVLLALAGALLGLGVYTYNAYLLFVPVAFVPLAWAFARARGDERVRVAGGAVVFAAAALLVALPMAQYALDHGETYRFHQKVIAVTSCAKEGVDPACQKWADSGLWGRAKILVDRAGEWERALVRGDRIDLGDGLASGGRPVVDPITFLLALVGLGVALWNWRRSEYAIVLAALLVLPFGALLTVGDGLFRRTLGLAPFVALLAAFPIAWAWQRAVVQGEGARRWIAAAAVAAIMLYVGVTDVRQYFDAMQHDPDVMSVYPFEDDAASKYIATLPPGTLVYFYSYRWSFDYETRRFLAPHAAGIDRSREFGGIPEGEEVPLGADRARASAFVFLEPYMDLLDEVVRRYPGGTITEGRRGGALTFRAYYLPPETPGS